MKNIAALLVFLMLYSCDFRSSGTDKQINQDLTTVTDSISLLMAQYHYNPSELVSDEYLELEKIVQRLADTVQTKEEFVSGFNEIWRDGPFSHVRLGIAERRAEEMADFIDSLRVGDHSVSLEWAEETAILTVTTMTGVDTKERIFEAYRDIAANDAKALIIDLRNNSGGTFAGVPLVGHVLTDSIDAGIFVSRNWWQRNTEVPGLSDIQNLTPWHGWSIKSFWHDVQEQPLTRVNFKPMNPHFDGPVYVLTSTNSASAAEFAVDAFAHEEKVTIIGETTAGEMLSQKMYDLPYGFQLSLPIAEYYSTRIGRIEGKGVEPHIAIDQSVALNLAISLIGGEKLEEAMAKLQLEIDKMGEQPFEGEPVYLFGNMNDWGKKWNITPQFEYVGNGIFKTTTRMKKGFYEFKIAPANWAFDYGASSNQERIIIGQKTSLIKVAGSSNLTIDIEDDSEFTFSLDVSDEDAATLYVSKK